MNPRLLALVLPVALCLVSGGRSAAAEDLMQIYREAQLNDPAIAAANPQWLATQERMPQAKIPLPPGWRSASRTLAD